MDEIHNRRSNGGRRAGLTSAPVTESIRNTPHCYGQRLRGKESVVAYAAQPRPGFFGVALRRRWLTLVVGTLLGLAAGIGATMFMPPSYVSQATLILDPVVGNPFEPGTGLSRTEELAALQTEASLVAGADVAALAVQSSTLPLPDSPETQVSAQSPSNSQVLYISFAAGRPEVATAGAQAFADGYLDYRRQQAEAAYAAEAAQLQEQIDRTTAVIDQTADALAAAETNSASAIQLQQQLSVYASQLAQLNLQLSEFTAGVPSVGEVITPATTAEAAGLPWWVIVAGATTAAVGLALMTAFAREHADGRVYDADELIAVGAGHPLATVPIGPATVELGATTAEGFSLLHTVIVARQGTATPVVCVVGTHRSSVAEVVGSGLAATAHRVGRSVLLVSDRWPRGWTDAQVLSAYGASDRRTWQRAAPGESTGLAVLPLDGDAQTEKLVMSPAVAALIDAARSHRELVVLSGGSSTSAVSRRLATLADLTMVAVELGADHFDDVVALVESLHETGTENIALVAVTTTGWRPGRHRLAVRWRRERATASPSPIPDERLVGADHSASTPTPIAPVSPGSDQPDESRSGPVREMTPRSLGDPDSSAGRRAG